MRLNLLFFLSVLLIQPSAAQPRQPKGVVYSAASDWQKVTLQSGVASRTVPATRAAEVSSPPASADAPASPLPTAGAGVPTPTVTRRPVSPTSNYRPAFTGDFSTRRNGWKVGVKGDYQYQIGMGRYNILKRNANTRRAAFSSVQLPANINLNLAEEFTIKVDMIADSGRMPTGGLLFGVSDSLNYSAFTINSTGDIVIVRVADGRAVSDYMPGDSFKPGVPVERNRNRLIVRRKDDQLHFYINDLEVRSSPYPFRLLSGNGIGMTTTGSWTSFQKLSVTLGP